MFGLWRPALSLFVLLTLLCGVLYPAAVTAITQLVWRPQANGSLLRVGERIVGSELIGQPFQSDCYFWSRPSVTPQHPYNGAASSGSNLGPRNEHLVQAMAERAAALRLAHPEHQGAFPVDLLTSSASGLDPHISAAAAFLQVSRVAAVRKIPAERIRALVQEHVEGSTLSLLGELRVNVLRLNLALDELAASTPAGHP